MIKLIKLIRYSDPQLAIPLPSEKLAEGLHLF